MHLQSTPMLIEEFEYPAIHPLQPQLWHNLLEIGGKSGIRETASDREKSQTADAVKIAQESAADTAAQNFEAGRRQGIIEGRHAMQEEQRAAFREIETQRIRCAAELIEQFAQERDRLLQSVENEVARLALAIAARILRREAQMDPLFLTGAVRVALGQLAETTQVRLRVPAAEAELWRETVEHIPSLKVKPSITPDEHLRTGDCNLETELGSADLGVHSQLGEIERGFFDHCAPGTQVSRSEHARVLS